ncbi:MAG: transporter substrate-binding domain-containing protein [Pseudomonadota bacterium]
MTTCVKLAGACATAALLSMAGVVSLPATAQAQAIACGGTYTVVAGDTLSRIAGRAYGDPRSFPIVYNANSAVIGPNPGLIEIGQVYRIPCIDAEAPSTADAGAIRPEPTTQQLPAPEVQRITVVTGTDWAPFSNEDDPQGGMMTEVVNVALASMGDGASYKIDFVNDWGAHLRPLVSDHHYDFSMPWFRPNCDVVDRLGDGSKFRCNNLDWSEPLFEQVIGWYVRSAEPVTTVHSDFQGRNVCRPAGYATFMIEEHGLVAPGTNVSRPNSPRECFEGLVDGTYDVVVLASDVADNEIVQLPDPSVVRSEDGLSQVATLHAVISKTHPNGAEKLAMIDEGIKKIKDSGEWFSIVARHLAEHRAKTQ